jgi:hypothetical protein
MARETVSVVQVHRKHHPVGKKTRRRIAMTERKFFKSAGAVTAFAAIVFAGMVMNSRRVIAHDDDDERDEARVHRGFEIAPVPLNLEGKNRSLVGLGSYIVNAQADCNGCHSAGPQTEFAMGGNPYFGQKPTIVNPKTYLGGGRDFGPFPGPGPFPHIISRNLTPDRTGRAEGGNTFATFKAIIRTGIDIDKVHPTCTGKPDGTCLPAPFDGSLLQIMPWPIHANMTDHDLRAIYEYLSSIPCLEGGPNEPANRCQ